MERPEIKGSEGRVGVLLPGMGAVATTFIAGVEAIRQGLAKPVGSITQMNRIRLGKRTEGRNPLVKDFVPLAGLDQLVFGGWDPIPDDAYKSAVTGGVLDRKHLDPIEGFLSGVKPMPAVFDPQYVKKLDGPNKKAGATKKELAEALREDIRRFKAENSCERMVMVWCGSTEIFLRPGPTHENLDAFEKAMEENDPSIAPSMLYAYAALMEGVPYANGAPNLSGDIPALEALAIENGLPIAGKDFKTGQTLMKTILAPGLKTRMIGLNGWFSTNILGNRDGEVLD
ncbi:MAG: inositol-3-phosphate synthase, partial [Gemmatimonadetes bacterium]|nr:inositol-3-phosphate synthase [Gemmatimonadota bacterium]